MREVVNAPVATSSWYPILTCGSSKLVPPSGHTPGNRHDRRAKPVAIPGATATTGELKQLKVSGVVCISTPDNPRSNRPERRTALVARELVRYKVHIAALSETRVSVQGQLEEVGAGYTFF
ncbi:unnamed protein product [Schistocephalus solidus]|uniref:Uncharacterized protein n=1 Tax=Schistocephalus solidus TaxID=70667 RepID=A0A183SE90_SCHSO|nr:unnamed protein product [Schistocephalus solidus]